MNKATQFMKFINDSYMILDQNDFEEFNLKTSKTCRNYKCI